MRSDRPDCEDRPLVSVIVPNWNGRTLLPPCLDSIRAQIYEPIEGIVVDDGSTDDSASLVSTEYPDFRLVTLPQNTGFAHAANAGMRAARGSIIALLNNDAIADARWIEELVGALARHPEAGMAASKILLMEEPPRIQSAGDVFRREGVPDNRGAWEPDHGQYDDEGFVFGACGGALAYRPEMLEDVGLFDEDFFMYCEDVDLAFRAQLRGYTCVYAPQAVVRHRLGASSTGAMASYYCGRNFIRLIARDLPGEAWRRYWPRMLSTQLRIAVHALRHGREPAARARLRGQLMGLLSLPRLLGERRAIQARRTVDSARLIELLT
jgi:GT2 family glycosyltransferase